MSSLSKSPQQILNEALEESTEFNQKLDAAFISSQNLLERTKTSLMKTIETKCSKELNWLKANVDKGRTAEYEEKIEELNRCSARNDFGLSDFLKNIGEEEKIISEKDQYCLNGCFQKEKGNDQIKSCFLNCLKASYDGYLDLINKIDSRMHDINKLL
jgi:hypothetical protein